MKAFLLCSALLLSLACSLAQASFHESQKTHPERYLTAQPKETLSDRAYRKLFNRFIYDHDRYYSNELEKKLRLAVFKQNLRKIDLLNKEELGTAFYGVTQFTDMSEEEFREKSTGLRPELQQPFENDDDNINVRVDLNAPLPQAFDWRTKGGVTEVKNQGLCGSCWSFSVSGNIEGVHFAKSNQLVSLSEEQLVECDTLDQGCNGGWMLNAYKAVEEMGGLESESDYPYKGVMAGKCHLNTTAPRVNIDWFKQLSQNETEIAQWLVQNGPVSVGINAFAMQFYIHGISHPWKIFCPPNIDHGVLLVGFGVETKRRKQIPFWIIKNSWGAKWGESGYYRLYRGSGVCGINTYATTAGYN